MKKLIAMLLTLALVLGLTACGGSFETAVEAPTTETAGMTEVSGTCGENLTWVLDEEGTLTISGTGEMCDYDWGESPWYEYVEEIYNVVIEEGVTRIYDDVGDGYHLLTLTIPASVTSIENYYSLDFLTAIQVHPDNANYSSDDYGVLFNKEQTVLLRAPEGISGNYRIPDSVIHIDLDAFDCCENLTSVTITAEVAELEAAFENCYNLAAIDVVPENTCYSSDEHGVLFNKDQTVLIRVPEGFSGDYRIPDGVDYIDYYAFDGCSNLTGVEIPDGVSRIGDGVFVNCSSLTSITIPASLNWMGDAVFRYCYDLREIWFMGSAPEFTNYYDDGNGDRFSQISATVYYPANDPSWTEDVRQSYGGDITWCPYTGDDAIE